MNRARTLTIVILMLAVAAPAGWSQQRKSADSEQLGKALEYFAAGKYGEALNIFEPLSRQYTLNDRFLAYMGVCYWYEWQYDKACKLLDEVVPAMDVYAPHERSIYYYAAAESHFNLGQWREAIPYYVMQLDVCYDNEKGDAFFRMGFCHMFLEENAEAYGCFSSALAYYERYRNTPDMAARMSQIRTMLPGIEQLVNEQLTTDNSNEPIIDEEETDQHSAAGSGDSPAGTVVVLP